MTTVRWLQSHRTVARWANRIPPIRDWLSRRVWDEIASDPAFAAAIEEGRVDLAAGRLVRWEDVRR